MWVAPAADLRSESAANIADLLGRPYSTSGVTTLLRSMTGYGEAHGQNDAMAVAVEVRAINGRHFKLNIRSNENHSSLEQQIEAVVRQRIKRGTIHVQLRADRAAGADDFVINGEVLDSYRRQLEKLCTTWHTPDPVRVDSLLALPGVVQDRHNQRQDVSADWPLVKETLDKALEGLDRMRCDEGTAMAADLQKNCQIIAAELDQIEQRAPLVIENYRTRLTERVERALGELNVKVEPADLVREISLFIERSDISEEVVRLRSHLVQFDEITSLPESSGKKLDFLTQEMGREANTIGSKSNDVEISHHVIETKTAIERIREQVQNIE